MAIDPDLSDGAPAQQERSLPAISDGARAGVSLSDLQREIQQLRSLFDRRLSYDSAKDKAFDTLYEKMRQFDGDFQGSLKRGLLRSLLLLHDNMVATEGLLAESPEARGHVTHLRQELLDILYVEDVEPIGDLSGPYDRQRQEAVRTIATPNPAEDGTVAQVAKEGFMLAEKVLRPQKVVIRRYPSEAPGGED